MSNPVSWSARNSFVSPIGGFTGGRIHDPVRWAHIIPLAALRWAG
jgi:hypothetical protein